MRPGLPDRQQARFEQRAAAERTAHAVTTITAEQRAEFCGCKRPQDHSDGNDTDGATNA